MQTAIRTLIIVASIFFFAFFVANIIASQTIPASYFRHMAGDPHAVVSYLRGIRATSDFESQLKDSTELYGSVVGQNLNVEEKLRAQQIAYYERVLTQNPNSRDTLLTLSVLEKQNGDQARSADYMRRAKEIDPNISLGF
jgi:hypothetical protein